MKRLLTPLLLLLTALTASAQYNVTVTGQIFDSIGNPVANQVIYVTDSATTALGVSVQNYTYISDSFGWYVDSITLQGSSGTLSFATIDSCTGLKSTTTTYNAQTVPNTYYQGFILCFNATTQNTVPISGTVFSAQGNPFPNQLVTVIDSSSNTNSPPAVYTYITDANGQFSDSITLGAPTGTLYFLTTDSCSTQTVVLTYNPQSSPSLFNVGFVLCNTGSSTNCNYAVYNNPVTLDSNLTYAFGSTHIGTANSNYLWSFGDGSTSTNATPTHSYSQPGTYSYCLTVDSCPVVCDTINVYQRKKISLNGLIVDSAGFGLPNYPFRFQLQYSVGNNSYSGMYGATPSPLYTTDANGNYGINVYQIQYPGLANNNIQTWVFDGCLNTFQLGPQHAISINSNPVSFTDTFNICANSTSTNCNYTVSALPVAGFPNQAFFSYTGQSGSSYLWDFGDGNTSNQPAPFHTYAQPGTYYYCLTIDSCAPVCDSITVFAQGGGCDPFFFPVVNGSTVDIYPSLLTGQFVAIVDWGDGIVDTFTPATIPNIPNTISHTYAAPGNYSICFTHSNASLGCSNTRCESVVVSTSSLIQCNAEFIVDTVNSLQGNVVVWNTSYAINSGGQAITNTSFLWNFGDGNISTQPFPIHNYANPGIYAVCLTMTSIVAPSASSPGDTCVSTYCDTLGVDSLGNLIYKGVATGWTLRVLDPNSIGINEDVLGKVKTYPNPVTDILKVVLPTDISENVIVDIFTMSGARLMNQTIPAGSTDFSFDLSNLATGIYLMQLNINGLTKQVKIVKQ